jgi:hypothetical protein
VADWFLCRALFVHLFVEIVVNRLSNLLLPLTLALVASTWGASAFAGPPDHGHDETDTHPHQNGNGHDGHGNGWGNGHHKNNDGVAGVPELDKSVAGSAAVLLGGGVFVILGRRKKR